MSTSVLRLLVASVAVAALTTACPEPDNLPHLELAAGCQPLLAGADCLLPYPSDFFRVADDSMPSGYRIEHGGAAKLLTKTGTNADVTTTRAIDGFSRVPYIVAHLPHELSPEGFVRLFDDPTTSTTTASNTVLLEASSGRAIPHFVDLDPRAKDPARQAIVLHPLVPLEASKRYVVALHNVKLKDGSPAPAPEGFRRLRDGEGRSDPALAPLRQAYEDRILVALELFGLEKSKLQLAWEFTTGTDLHVERDMLRVRELTLAWLAAQPNGPTVTVTEVEEAPSADIWRLIRGTIVMPLFLTSTDPGSQLHRDEKGEVAQNGTSTFPFVAQIPNSVRDQFEPGRILSYGHGFFGGTGETEGASARRIANRMNAVMFATDWWGMSTADVAKVADALTNRPNRTFDAFERTHQAMANWMVLTRATETSIPSLAAFKRPTTPGTPGVVTNPQGTSNAGNSVLAGQADSYIGISQGHILGGVMTALNPDITRPVLQVGGAGFTHMMFRARPFSGYLYLIELSIPDPFEQQKFVATLQRHFDRFDPAQYARYLVTEKLPNGPDRRVLFQMGVADTQVPNLGTQLHARAAGIGQLADESPAIFGLPRVAPPHAGSALATYDLGFDVREINEVAIPAAEDNPVHEGVRKLEAALTQMKAFYDTGAIIHACSGRCDPE